MVELTRNEFTVDLKNKTKQNKSILTKVFNCETKVSFSFFYKKLII